MWSPSNSTDTRRLERLTLTSHHQYLLLITSICAYFSYSSRFLLLIYIRLHDTFLFAVDVTGRSGRNQHVLFVPRVRTDYGKQSLAYRGTTFWNKQLRTVGETSGLLASTEYRSSTISESTDHSIARTYDSLADCFR